MLSLQGMLAKNLDEKGILPQKFSDLALKPKYPRVKVVNASGVEQTDAIFNVGTYRFLYEDNSTLDYLNANWEFEFHTYITAVWNQGTGETSAIKFNSNKRFAHKLTSISYLYGSTETKLFKYQSNMSAYDFRPTHIVWHLAHTKGSTSVSIKYKQATTIAGLATASWSETKSQDFGQLSIFEIVANYNSTQTNQRDGWTGLACQVHYDDLLFIYNDRVVIGEN